MRNSASKDRLHVLYEVNRRLTTFSDLDELLRYATQQARELLEAEGCALLLVDRERKEFYFPVASQAVSTQSGAAELAEIRFGIDRGIAGWVLSNDQPALVNDAARDPRFFDGVDRRSHLTTHALLCAPLRTRAGNIGVIEVVNPASGAFSAEDLEFLEALANDIGVAHEKARLYEQLRGEVLGLRRLCALGGAGMAAIGVLFILATLLGHLAWALPLRELPTRPGIISGALALLTGAFLIGIGRGWWQRRAGTPPASL